MFTFSICKLLGLGGGVRVKYTLQVNNVQWYYAGCINPKRTVLVLPHATSSEGIMFLTHLSVSPSVMKDIMCRCAFPQESAQQNFLKLCSNEGHNV